MFKAIWCAVSGRIKLIGGVIISGDMVSVVGMREASGMFVPSICLCVFEMGDDFVPEWSMANAFLNEESALLGDL